MSDKHDYDGQRGEILGEALSLREMDKAIQQTQINFEYTLRDMILCLLYADRKPIRGKTKQQKEVFLAFKLIFSALPVQEIKFKKHRFGPYSEDVEHTIEQLVFTDLLQVEGQKRSNNFAIQISPSGMSNIKNKFQQLPLEIQHDLKIKRKQWDTHTRDGILNVVYTHFPEYLDKSVLKNRYKRLDWSNDVQIDEKQ